MLTLGNVQTSYDA